MGKEGCCGEFCKKIKKADAFASSLEFTVNGMSGGNTYIFGLITILLYIFGVVYFCYKLYRCLYRMDPNFIFYESETDEVALSVPENYLAFVGIPTAFGPNVFAKGYFCDFEKEPEGDDDGCKEIEFDVCKENENEEIDDIQKDFKEVQLFCPKQKIEKFEMTENKQIFIDFIAKNDYKDNGKKDLEQNDGFFFFLDQYVTPDDFDEPIQEYINYVPISFSGEYFKLQNLHIKEIEVSTEWSFFFNFEDTENSFCAEDFSTFDLKSIENLDSRYQEAGGKIISELTIDTTYNKDTYKRSYTKIPEVFAETTGIVDTIVIIISFILGPYTSFKLKEEFLKNVFDFDFSDKNERRQSIVLNQDEKEEGIKKKPKKKEVVETINLKENVVSINELDDPPREEETKKYYDTKKAVIKIGEELENAQKEFEIHQTHFVPKDFKDALFCKSTDSVKIKDENFDNISPKHEELNVSSCGKCLECLDFFELCCDSCFVSDKKALMVRHLGDIVDNYFETTYLAAKMNQIDTLKEILLTQDQLAMFNYISNDVIGIDGDFLYGKKRKIEPSTYWRDSTQKFFQYYEKIKDKPPTKTDKRILDMLDNRIENLEYEDPKN